MSIRRILKNNHNKKVMSVIIAFILICIIVARIEIKESIAALSNYTPTLIIVPFLTIMSTYVLDGVCQYSLLNSARIHFVTFVTRILQAQLFSMILPGRIGDVSLLYFFKKEPKGKILKTYFFSKMITVAVAFFLSQPVLIRLTGINLYFSYLISAIIFVFLLSLYMNVQKIWSIVIKITSGSFRERFEEVHIVPPSIGRFFITIVITFLRLIISGYGSFLLLNAIGVSLEFRYVVSVVSLVFLIGLMPITPMGIGVAELGYVFLYSLFGIDESISIAVPIMGRILQFASMAIFSLTLIWLPIGINEKNEELEFVNK